MTTETRDKAQAFRQRIIQEIEAYQRNQNGELEQQAQWLDQEIAREMVSYRTLSYEYKVLKGEITAFMMEYYAAVGEYIEELEHLDEDIDELRREYGGETEEYDTPSSRSGWEELEELNFSFADRKREDMSSEQVKRLYRKLAKCVHPDVMQHDPKAAEIFAILNASYINHDLEALIAMEQEFLMGDVSAVDENMIIKVERLEKEYDEIKQAADRLKLRHHALVNSPAYKLHQRSCWYKMCGDDLITKVQARLQLAIQRKKSSLAREKLKHQMTVPPLTVMTSFASQST